MASELLPIHGFVLAGGRSSRMGRDKVLIEVNGKSMVQIALEKLRSFCEDVAIAGDRDDLAHLAPIVHEWRDEAGPAAGVEAGLKVCSQEWAMFIPVDVPLVPAELLRRWAERALSTRRNVSYLGMQGKQPAFCLLQREREGAFSALLEGGERKLEPLLNFTAKADGYTSWMYDERDLYGYANNRSPDADTLDLWFSNINTPDELAVVQNYLRTLKRVPTQPAASQSR